MGCVCVWCIYATVTAVCVLCPVQSYVQEGDGDGPAVFDQESIISRDTPTSSAENKRYNLRVIPPGLEAASSLSPLRQTSGQAGKTRQRKNPNPKVLVCAYNHLCCVCVRTCVS